MILGRAYFREIAQRLLLVLAGVVFLVGIGAAIRASSTSQGAPLWVALSLVPLIIGQALPYFFPVALLTAVVVTYGRMAGDGEMVACMASGKRPLALLGAPFAAAMLVGAASYPFAAEVVPDLYRQMRVLGARVPLAALENTNPGASELHFGGLHLSWNGRRRDGAMQDVLLAWSTGTEDDGATPRGEAPGTAAAPGEYRLRAETGRMDVVDGVLRFTFEDMRYIPGGEHKGNALFEVPIEQLQRDRVPDLRARDKSSRAIVAALATELEPVERDAHLYVFWQRIANALVGLPLAAIGALLGWRLRRGGFLAALSASLGLLLLIYYPVFFLAKGMQKSGALGPLVAAWLPIAVLMPVAVVLLWRAGRA